MAEVKDYKMPGRWAENAYTTIPQPPVTGLSYRNDELTEEETNTGQRYGSLGDSATWNQLLWAMSGIAKSLEEQGALSWSPLIDYNVGALVMGTNDHLYIALQPSGPNTELVNPAEEEESDNPYWLDVNEKLAQPAGDSVPIGMPGWFAADTPPDGWLTMNGAEVGRETYPELFAVIGTRYGAGDGSTTFNLPNALDRHVKGSLVPGQLLEAGLPNIEGTMHWSQDWVPPSDGAFHTETSTTGTGAFHNGPQVGYAYGTVNIKASRYNSIYGNSNTVQPPSITFLPCIKAFHTVQETGDVTTENLADEIARLNGLRVATTNITIYVRTDGSDSNSGLSENDAFLTINKAINTVHSYFFAGPYEATIDVGEGTFNEYIDVGFISTGNKIQIIGKGTGTVISSTNSYIVRSAYNGNLWLKNVKLQCSNTYNAAAIICCESGYMRIENITVSGTLSNAVIQMYSNGEMHIEGYFHALMTSAAMCFYVSFSECSFHGTHDTIINGAYSISVAYIFNTGMLLLRPQGSITGNATGQRYQIHTNSILNAGGRGVNAIPGSSAGAIYSGGIYG